MLLWLWCRRVATAPIRPLAWELPYATGPALKILKKERKEKKRNKIYRVNKSRSAGKAHSNWGSQEQLHEKDELELELDYGRGFSVC